MDWARVDRMLCEAYQGLTPRSIGQMTLPEIAVMLMDRTPGPAGGRPMSQQEIEAAIRAARAMTAAQRIASARESRRG